MTAGGQNIDSCAISFTVQVTTLSLSMLQRYHVGSFCCRVQCQEGGGILPTV